MLFNTVQFAAFFVGLLVVYWSLPQRFRTPLLLLGSYFFYGCWDPRFLGLIALSTIVDYVAGLRIAGSSSGTGRAWLFLSVVTNLGLLGFFKYFNFFAANLQELLGAVGLSVSMGTLDVILPVGISFYTFQTLSYTIDVYRKQLSPTRNFVDFAVFVSFFPQLVAGPIERAKALLPQVSRKKVFSWKDLESGFELMAWGLFKKMVVADNLAGIVDHVYGGAVADQTGLQVLLATYAFALQIYCDFSGYTDVARGAARCLGFELRLNFFLPYFATNPPDFWRRWHISLSSWLRDYLYIPLGGNRGGSFRMYRNLCLTMLLGGLWHGAAWTFILWGAFHGAILVIHRLFLSVFSGQPSGSVAGVEKTSGPFKQIWWLLRVAFFFHVTCLGWMIFRAESVGQVGEMLLLIGSDWSLCSAEWYSIKALVFYGWFLVLIEMIAYSRSTVGEFDGEVPALFRAPLSRGAVMGFVIISILLFGAFHAQKFIYFQF